MMRIIIFLQLVLLFSSQVNAQFLFTRQDSTNNHFSNIVEEPGGTYLFSNSNFTQQPNFYITAQASLIRLNNEGKFVKSLKLDSNFLIGPPLVFLNNRYFLFGTLIKHYSNQNSAFLPMVLEIDTALEIQQRITLDSAFGGFFAGVKMVSTGNRFYFAMSRTQSADSIKILATDKHFNRIDSTVLPGSFGDLEVSEFHLRMVGREFPQSATGFTEVLTLDSNFVITSRLTTDSLTYEPVCGLKIAMFESGHLKVIDSGKYFLAGASMRTYGQNCDVETKITTVLATSDSILKVNFHGVDQYRNQQFGQSNCAALRGGYIFAVGYAIQTLTTYIQPQNAASKLVLTKTDTAGTVIWEKLYGGDLYYLPLSLAATVDGGVVVTGFMYDPLNPKVQGAGEGFVMKFDSEGEPVMVSVSEEGKIFPRLIRAYPSPAHDNIQFSVLRPGPYTIRIFDISGVKVSEEKDRSGLSPVDISGLPPGTYIYQINTTQSIFHGKFVKE